MRRQKWKRKAALALTVIMAGTAAGGIHQVDAASKIVMGNYQKLFVSAINSSSTVTIFNLSKSTRYVYVAERTYDKNNKLVRSIYYDGKLERGGRSSVGLPLKGVKKVKGIGKIFNGTTGKLTLLETKTATVQP